MTRSLRMLTSVELNRMPGFTNGYQGLHAGREILVGMAPELDQLSEEVTEQSEAFTRAEEGYENAASDDDQRELLRTVRPELMFESVTPGFQQVSQWANSAGETLEICDQWFVHSEQSPEELEIRALIKRVSRETTDARAHHALAAEALYTASEVSLQLDDIVPAMDSPDVAADILRAKRASKFMYTMLNLLADSRENLTRTLDRVTGALSMADDFEIHTPVPERSSDGQRAKALAILESLPALSAGGVARLAVDPLERVLGEFGSGKIGDHYEGIRDTVLVLPPTSKNLWALAWGETQFWETQDGFGKLVSAEVRYAMLMEARADALRNASEEERAAIEAADREDGQ